MTVLVDTSVWIEHLRHGQPALAELLTEASVLLHPFIAGELACGNLKNRAGLLTDLRSCLSLCRPLTTKPRVWWMIADFWGRGLGWVDAHLLASALLSHCGFWTLDGRLAQAARCGIAIPSSHVTPLAPHGLTISLLRHSLALVGSGGWSWHSPHGTAPSEVVTKF